MYVEVQTSWLFFGKSFALKCKTNCLFNVKKQGVFPMKNCGCCKVLHSVFCASKCKTCCLFFGKKFCVEAQTSCLFNVKKARCFTQGKTAVVAKFCTVFFVHRSAKQGAVSSAKSFALKCKTNCLFNVKKQGVFPMKNCGCCKVLHSVFCASKCKTGYCFFGKKFVENSGKKVICICCKNKNVVL